MRPPMSHAMPLISVTYADSVLTCALRAASVPESAIAPAVAAVSRYMRCFEPRRGVAVGVVMQTLADGGVAMYVPSLEIGCVVGDGDVLWGGAEVVGDTIAVFSDDVDLCSY